MRILFVCTGNLCRSPLAERWATAHLGPLLEGPASVVFESAGTAAADGRPMDRTMAGVLEREGGSAAGFSSRRISTEMITAADLVLTMTVRQRREVLDRHPAGLKHTFTVREAAALADQFTESRWAAFQAGPATWVGDLARALHGGRAARAASGCVLDDDTDDPIGARTAVHLRIAAEITGSLAQIFLPLALPLHRPGAQAPSWTSAEDSMSRSPDCPAGSSETLVASTGSARGTAGRA